MSHGKEKNFNRMDKTKQTIRCQAENICKLEKVMKSFSTESGKTVSVLKNIDLCIEAGQLITLVGPTGSGKTTLLNLIAGLIEPDAGNITFSSEINVRKDLAYVFQHYTLLPWRTVLKNITFGLQLRGIETRRRNKRAEELMEQVGLKGFEKACPHELSGGMRQRVAIAQAMAIKPKLFLMDEPFGSLDDITRSELQQMLIKLHQQSKTTILFVTHNIDEAIMLADRVLVLNQSPAVIQEDIEVSFPHPRNKTNPNFSKTYMQIRNLFSTEAIQ